MTDRFYADDSAIRGRAGIFDRDHGNRLVAFFLNDPSNPDAAPRLARICAGALNAAATRQTQRRLGDG